MKKVSVQFNLMVADDVTHKDVRELIKTHIENYNKSYGKVTSVEVNNIERK